jgi:hypothetical protein
LRYQALMIAGHSQQDATNCPQTAEQQSLRAARRPFAGACATRNVKRLSQV